MIPEDEQTASFQQDQDTENWFKDPSLEGVGNNMAHILAVNSGNEAVRESLGEEIAASNSGRASKDVNYLARNIDQSQQAMDKSVHDERLSADLSALGRMNAGVENDALDGVKPEHLAMLDDMNDFPQPSDTQQVIQAVYGFMMFAGFPEGQLAAGMGAEAKQTDLETAEMANMYEDNAALQSLYDIADDMGLGDMQEYLQNAHAFHLQTMEGAGVKDLPQLVGVEPEPVEPTVTPDMDPVLAQQLEQQVDLGGPVAPTAMNGPK